MKVSKFSHYKINLIKPKKVHFKSEYGGIGPALNHADGLAVVGHFLEVVDTTDETAMDKFLQDAVNDNLLEESSEKEFTFNLADLGLADFDDYYRYSGSLTTPPCNEVVQWTVVKDTLKINKDTMQIMLQFSKVRLKSKLTIYLTFRQKLVIW